MLRSSCMAVLAFPASYRTPLEEMARLLRLTRLNKKGRLEVLSALDAVSVWQDWFSSRYGPLTEIRHRSNPDDPPDIDLVFERESVGLEHTLLMPPPLGHAEAIADEINPGGGRILPGISGNFSRQDLEQLAFLMAGKAPWSNVADDHRIAVAALLSAVQRKIRDSGSQVVCVNDKASLEGAGADWLASELYAAVNTNEFADLGDRTVIFLQRDNHIQFFSALVRRGEPLRALRDSAPVVPRAPLFY